MLNITLLRRNLKSAWKLWSFFEVVMIAILLGIAWYYDPHTGIGKLGILEQIPESFAFAMGVRLQDNSLTGTFAFWLYGSVFLILPLLYEVILINRLVAGQVSGGMMSYLLSVPVSRKEIIRTQSYFFFASLFLLFAGTGLAGIAACTLLQPGQLEIPQFVLLNIGAFCLHLCIGGILFLASCISNTVLTSLMIGVGMPILFYLTWLLANVSETLEVLKLFTVFTLFQPHMILEGDQDIYWMLPALAAAGLLLSYLGKRLFERRDLPL